MKAMAKGTGVLRRWAIGWLLACLYGTRSVRFYESEMSNNRYRKVLIARSKH